MHGFKDRQLVWHPGEKALLQAFIDEFAPLRE